MKQLWRAKRKTREICTDLHDHNKTSKCVRKPNQITDGEHRNSMRRRQAIKESLLDKVHCFHEGQVFSDILHKDERGAMGWGRGYIHFCLIK